MAPSGKWWWTHVLKSLQTDGPPLKSESFDMLNAGRNVRIALLDKPNNGIPRKSKPPILGQVNVYCTNYLMLQISHISK